MVWLRLEDLCREMAIDKQQAGFVGREQALAVAVAGGVVVVLPAAPEVVTAVLEQRVFGHGFVAAVILRQAAVIVRRIKPDAETDLMQVRHALGLLALNLRPAQGRQQQRREERDDGDDDQKLDAGEGAGAIRCSSA
jgi:hypothetical protein